MWFVYIYHWFIGLFVEKAVESAIDGEHVEPEESDWDWSKSPDANVDEQEVTLVTKESDVSLFLGELSDLITRGFDSPQVSVLINKIGKMSAGEHWYVEFHIKAFDRGTPLKIIAQRLDHEHVGFIIVTDSALSFEIANRAPKYDQSGKSVEPPQHGLN